MRRSRRGIAMLAAVVSVVSTITVVSWSTADEAEAADAAAFQAGNIVSDENFYDGDAMNAQQTQAFIEGQLARCTAGYTCIRDYRQATPTMAANAYCQAIGGQGGESAASIIARVGAACNISQRYLLVLLQKEQSLITDPDPSQRQFDRATGFACPDTAPCDSSYGGFFYQVYYAARQFNVYAAFPRSFNHQPAAWNNVLYHPNAACGSSRVYIQNRATAGLYNYTPYQPNAAALANLYGTGDGCSAYGNRNTWRMWSDWFGDPTRAQAATFIRNEATGQVYLVADGRKFYVPDPALFQDFAPLYRVESRSASYVNSLQTGANLSNVVRGPNGAVYLVQDGARYYFRSCEDITTWGYSCGDSAWLSNDQVSRLTSGGDVQMTVRLADGSNWLVQSGTRRQLSDIALPQQFGYPAATTNLAADGLAHLPVGTPVVHSGAIVRSSDHATLRLVTGAGTFQGSSAVLGLRFTWNTQVFDVRSLALMPPNLGTLPTRLEDSTGAYVVGDTGLLRVDKPQYGSLAFQRVPDGAVGSLPRMGVAAGPHLIAEYGGGGWWLIANGRRMLVQDAAHYQQVRAAFGVPAVVWTVARGSTLPLPQASSLQDGWLVRGPSGAVYLMDGGNGIHISSLEIPAALGLPLTIRDVPQSTIDGMVSRQGVMNDFGVVCNGTSYLAAGGVLYPYASQAARQAWGRGETTFRSLCGQLTISQQAVDRFAYEPNGRTYFLEGGQLRYIPDGATFATLGGTATNRIRISAGQAGMIPKGQDAVATPQSGQLITIPGDGRVYVVDGTRLLHLGSWSVSGALGLGASPIAMSASQVAGLTGRGQLYSPLVVCGSTAYVGVGGRLLPMSAQVRAEFPASAFTTLDAATCARIPVSTTQMTTIVRGSDGRVYAVVGGTRHWLGGAALQRLGGAAAIRDVDDTVIGTIPIGETWNT